MARESVGLRVLAAIVGLMPGEARRAYGREILLVCRRRMEEAEEGGGGPGAGFWLGEWAGGLRAVAAAWRDRLSAASPPGRGSLPFEVRTVARMLLRRPVFALSVVLILGMGVGANAGVSGVGWSVLVSPLPFPDAERLVRIFHGDDLSFGLSLNELRAYRRSARSLADVAGWTVGGATLEGDDGAARVARALVTPNLFRVLGRRPLFGPGFDPRGRDGGVVLSHRFWRSRYGGAEDVTGRVLRLDGELRPIRGVLPRAVSFPDPTVDLYVPIDFSRPAEPGRGGLFLDVVGRLAPGVEPDAAAAEVAALAERLREEDPGAYEAEAGFGGFLVPFRDVLVRRDRPVLLALVAAAVLLLLAACFSVATLVTARVEERGEERQIRRALGAGAGLVARLHLVEVGLLGLAGAVVGAVVSVPVARSVASYIPDGQAVAGAPLEMRVVALTLLIALLGTAAVGVLTLPRSAGESFRPGSVRTSTASTSLLYRALPGVQVALAVVLVSGGVLFYRTVRGLASTDLGYDVQRVLSARISLPDGSYGSPELRRTFFRVLLDRLADDPSIHAAAVVNALPLTEYGGSGDVTLEAVDPDSAAAVVTQRVAGAGFFDVLGIPLLAGRAFEPSDRPESAPVAVVDERFARRFFGEPRRAVGQRIRFFFGGDAWNEIVGVVGHVRLRGPGASSGPQLYVPFAQRPTGEAHVVVRHEGRLAPATRAIRDGVRRIDPSLPVYDLAPMEERLLGAIRLERFTLGVFSAFGVLALLLAGAGTYGLLALTQRRRRREIGIRRTLGAPVGDVVRSVAGRGMAAVGVGVVCGAAGATALGVLLRSLVDTVSGGHVLPVVSASAALLVTGGVAVLVPVLRALRVDPASTLKGE